MTKRAPNIMRTQVLVTFLVALGLLFAGMRVPDISRPQRPKPLHRAVVEVQKQLKNSPDSIACSADVLAILPQALRLNDTVSFRADSPFVEPRYASARLIPNPGRSPPSLRS